MHDLFPRTLDDIKIQPGRTIYGQVAGLFAAPERTFVTQAVDRLDLTFEGITGDFHQGITRRSGGREPWYARGTEMRNERQLSIVAPDEMSEIAQGMGLPEVRCEWIGANILMEGVPHLSMLPAGTLMFFRYGVTLKVDSQNQPCKLAGRSVGEQAGMADVHGASLLFPKIAKRRRGLVAWVEKPGTISAGETVSLRLPEQWVY
ncbi:molybdenum cofactor sulfurase [Tianweitania sp. BSSL-BM11]|uniref:Molybdenum cofactor sulfurase n=1 Tax=Tianweitania aestuarii TaxID=2814886 RepID=A0ABS5RV68_9HYPH|nr:MOSC domain-containing protein [Tianweitania aestuarii]MBS9720943.1 molybdenum cofactor sulfurase [Tianweitania aestuarii]